MFSPDLIECLDALGSVSVHFDQKTGKLQVQGLPCKDWHHRGFEIRQEQDAFFASDALGRELGRYEKIDEALTEGVRAVAGIDIANASLPPLQAVPPSSARCCRDWSVYLSCFDYPPTVEREDVIAALLDALSGGCLTLLQAPAGAGGHAVIAGLARRLLLEPQARPSLAHSRVLELDWLKLSAPSAQGGGMSPAERLAQTVTDIAEHGHIPVIPRGRARALAQVLAPGLAGIVLHGTPQEVEEIPVLTNVVRMRLPDLSPHQLRMMLDSAARSLAAVMEVEMPTETVDYVWRQAAQRRDDDIGPMVHQAEPGALTTLLGVACQRGLQMARQWPPPGGRVVITPTHVGMTLLNLGASDDAVMNSLLPPLRAREAQENSRNDGASLSGEP